jgi:cholesterol transport system auxiliary component
MNRAARITAVVAAALSLCLLLGGCVSLLPTTKPVQLYELNPDLGGGAGPAGGARVGVRLAPLQFEPAASGDRMLTIKGAEAAYIANARWVAPAQTLFETDLERAFAQHGTTARLISRIDNIPSTMTLMLDVDAFHVRYASGSAPTVEVVLRARLLRGPNRDMVMEQTFSAAAPASSDRVSAIVEAYDAALSKALVELVAATDAQAAQTPPAG